MCLWHPKYCMHILLLQKMPIHMDYKNVAQINNTPDKNIAYNIFGGHWKNAPQKCATHTWHLQNIACTKCWFVHLWWCPNILYAPMRPQSSSCTPKCCMHPLLLKKCCYTFPWCPKIVTWICDDAYTLHAPITNQSVLQQAPMMPRKMLLHTPTMLQNCCNMCLWLPKRCMHLLLLENYAHINNTPNNVLNQICIDMMPPKMLLHAHAML